MIWEYGGTNKDHLLQYVPAIVFTLYDGYYLYTTTNTTEVLTDEQGVGLLYEVGYEKGQAQEIYNSIPAEIRSYYQKRDVEGDRTKEEFYDVDYDAGDPIPIFDNNGEEVTEEKHMLKSFTPYAVRYKKGDTDVTINYTLDNYIKVYLNTFESGKNVFYRKAGYLIDPDLVDGNINNLTYARNSISREILTEQAAYRGMAGTDLYEKKTYNYIYEEDNSKLYYDSALDRFFRVDYRGVQSYLPETRRGDRDIRILL
jgi:hypothetical protein